MKLRGRSRRENAHKLRFSGGIKFHCHINLGRGGLHDVTNFTGVSPRLGWACKNLRDGGKCQKLINYRVHVETQTLQGPSPLEAD